MTGRAIFAYMPVLKWRKHESTPFLYSVSTSFYGSTQIYANSQTQSEQFQLHSIGPAKVESRRFTRHNYIIATSILGVVLALASLSKHTSFFSVSSNRGVLNDNTFVWIESSCMKERIALLNSRTFCGEEEKKEVLVVDKSISFLIQLSSHCGSAHVPQAAASTTQNARVSGLG